MVALLKFHAAFTPSLPKTNPSAFTTPSISTSLLKLADESASSAKPEESRTPPTPVKCPDCDMCDGSGRILGGIGVIAPWWPIKAYRPCPNFINRGGSYTRIGQPLDEIAFGRDSTYNNNKNNRGQ